MLHKYVPYTVNFKIVFMRELKMQDQQQLFGNIQFYLTSDSKETEQAH